LLNAGLLGLAQLAGYAPDAVYATRALTMGVCLVTVYFALRSVERVFAGQPAQQALGMVIAATLPASIYMGHAFGNEPYFACCAALALYLLVTAPPQERRPRITHAVLLGLTCGLALLAKTSAVLLTAVFAVVLAAQGWRGRRCAALKEVAVFLACCALVAGWWYLRNLIELGRPFVGGWEQGRGIDWWQYPGYRTLTHLTGFGAVFVQPVYAGLAGFWDSVYSSLWGDGYLSGITGLPRAPDWNLPAMAALYLLAVPLTLAVIAGTLRTLLAPAEPPLALATSVSAAMLLLFLAAMLHLYATVPIYSAAKGSYLMALAPGLGILAAWGAGPLLQLRAAQVIAAGVMSVWIGAVGLAFVAVGEP
jgi:4-amino-4-deoxy-L-arabinose transferase-like glycosyltransferase